MIRKTLVSSHIETWSIGLSQSHLHTSFITHSCNWNPNQDFAWCWSQPRPWCNFIVGSMSKSWSQWI